MNFTGLIFIKMEKVDPVVNEMSKSDGLFYDSFRQATHDYQKVIRLDIFTIVLFGIITANILTETEYAGASWMALCFSTIVATAVLQLTFAQISLNAIFNNPDVYLAVAQNIGHVVSNEPVLNTSPSIHECYSFNVYLVQSNGRRSSHISQFQKSLIVSITKQSVIQGIKNRHPLFKWSELVIQLVNLASVILSVIALASQDMSFFRKMLLVLYVVIVGFYNIIPFIVLFLLCLLPIVLLVFLFYYFVLREKPQAEYIDLKPHSATQSDLMEAKGNCTICFQPLAINQSVYNLPCSSLHVFHSSCLDKWSVVKSTCPMCRAPIPMTNRPPQ